MSFHSPAGPTGPKNDYASSMNWILSLPPETLLLFGAQADEQDYVDRVAALPNSWFAWSHERVDAQSNVHGLLVWDVVAQLRHRKLDHQVFFKISFKWFCRHRTQRPFYVNTELCNSNGNRLTIAQVEPFVIDCQCAQAGFSVHEPAPVQLDTPSNDYIRTVSFGRMLLPELLPPDHGVVCG